MREINEDTRVIQLKKKNDERNNKRKHDNNGQLGDEGVGKTNIGDHHHK